MAAVPIVCLIGFRLARSAPVPQASQKLAITTKSLPNATVGVEYYAVIAASGGEAPYDCSGVGLPPNLAFHYTSDTIGGKATTPGAYSARCVPLHSFSVTMHFSSAARILLTRTSKSGKPAQCLR